MNKLILTSLALLAISCFSCKKTTDTPAVVLSAKTTFLTNAAWKVSKAETQNTGSTVWVNVTSSNPACRNDDVLKYNTNFKLNYDEGALKCNASDPQTTVSDWSFQTNETLLNAGGQVGEISVLDANTLVLIYTTTPFVKVRNTFIH